MALNDTERTDRPIKFIAKENIYWDDWGYMRLVFRKGRKYVGIQHSDGSVTAETPFYTDISDYVDITKIEIF